MNKIMFDILNHIHEGNEWDLKEFSKTFYKPYSVMEQEYRMLQHEGFLKDGKMTQLAQEYLDKHEIKNALILAAGVSSRFVPVCFEKPKALLKIKGEVLIERQIRQLNEVGIKDIVIVVGYMKEKFNCSDPPEMTSSLGRRSILNMPKQLKAIKNLSKMKPLVYHLKKVKI